MKQLLLILSAICLSTSAYCQQEIETSYSYKNNEAIITATVHGHATFYSLILEYTQGQNFYTQKHDLKVITNSGEVARLKLINPNQESFLQYQIKYIPGKVLNKQIDSNFVYYLPYSPHKKDVQYSYASSILSNQKKSRIRNSISLVFTMAKGDTIFAARKGIVYKRIVNDPATTHNAIPHTRENSIYVQHEDGTSAVYQSIERFLVSEGDEVFPGTPLAIVGAFNYTKYMFYFTVFNVLVEEDATGDPDFTFEYYNPVFATDEGITRLNKARQYLAVFNKDLITAEMSGREKKQYASGTLPKIIPPKETITPVEMDQQAAKTTSTANTSAATNRRVTSIKLDNFRGPEGEYAVDAWMQSTGLYSVLFNFNDPSNCPAPPFLVDTMSTDRRLFNFKPIDKNMPATTRYRWISTPGNALAVPDTNRVYHLPFSKENTIAATSKTPSGSIIRLKLSKGDTIYPPDKGVVIQIAPLPDNTTCRLVLQNSDYTLSDFYVGLTLESLLVEEGQRIETSTPVAVFPDSNANGWLYLSMRYPTVTDSGDSSGNKKFKTCYFNPIFATSQGQTRLGATPNKSYTPIKK